jgi:hypothetical protein
VTTQTDFMPQPRLREPSGAEAVASIWSTGPEAVGSRTGSDSRSAVEGICRTFFELDGLERAYVLRAISPPTPDKSAWQSGPPVSRSRIACFLALCCLGLIPWTIGLAVTLPRSYLVANWPLAWVGFDIILLGCLGTTAWALWQRRQVATVASMITSILLFCDAWFDVLTAHGGRCLVLSITTAVLAEIPIGILLGLISIRLQRASRDPGPRDGASSISLWRMPLSWPEGSRGSRSVGRRRPARDRRPVPAAKERKGFR